MGETIDCAEYRRLGEHILNGRDFLDLTPREEKEKQAGSVLAHMKKCAPCKDHLENFAPIAEMRLTLAATPPPPPAPISDEEAKRNIEYFAGLPLQAVEVPQSCIAVHTHDFSHLDHWASYDVHAEKTTVTYSPRFGRVRILRPGESMSFPWCPLTPDDDFNFRFREVTIANENGTAKESSRITDILPCESY